MMGKLAFYNVKFYNVLFSDELKNSYKAFCFVIIKPTWNPTFFYWLKFNKTEKKEILLRTLKCQIIRIGFSQRPVKSMYVNKNKMRKIKTHKMIIKKKKIVHPGKLFLNFIAACGNCIVLFADKRKPHVR